MTKRPLCLVCLLLAVLLCGADRLGLPLIVGNPMPESLQAWAKKEPQATICGEVAYSADTESSQSVYLKNVCLIYQSQKIPIQQVRAFLKEKAAVKAGAVLVLSGKLVPVPEPGNPGEFDSVQYYAAQHIYYWLKEGVVEAKSRSYAPYRQFLLELRERLTQSLYQAGGKEGPVFAAMALGDKKGLEASQKLRYQMGGIIHILAISGLHVSVLGMGFWKLLKRLGAGNGLAGTLVLAGALSYGIMTGGSLSALRAVCMLLVSAGARILGRIYDMPTALSLAALLILLESPASLYGSSFLLSFGAVLGIGVLAPVLEEALGGRRRLLSMVLSSASVSLMTLPVSLYFFGEVSLAGIVLNLAVLPTVSVVLVSGLAGAVLGLIGAVPAKAALFPGQCLLKVYEQLCILAGRLPFCTWTGGRPGLWQVAGYYVLLGCLAFGLKVAGGKKLAGKKGRRAAAVLLLLAFLAAAGLLLGHRPDGSLTIACLDVGQGDAAVIETPEGARVLIDGGSSNKSGTGQYQLLPYLKSRGISRLDGIFISHTDEDHISGVRELLQMAGEGLISLRVGMLALPAWEEPPKAYEELCLLAKKAGASVVRLKAGGSFRMGSVKLEALWPGDGAAGKDVNEEGLVLRLTCGEFSGLFTGDIGEETEKKLLLQKRLGDVDFLKVAHHGSRYSTGNDFLAAVQPEVAVVSSSAANTYGHPSPETLERLRLAGAQVWCTKDWGAVTLTVKGESIKTQGFRVPAAGF